MISFMLKIKHSMPWLWQLIEYINGLIIAVRFPNIKKSAMNVLTNQENNSFEFSLVTEDDVKNLVHFFKKQPSEYFIFFSPHGFGPKTIYRLLNNPGYILMKIISVDNHDKIVGYFFLRCFFTGKAFHGLMVDKEFQNQGLGTAMWHLSSQICSNIGLKMYATVSKDNLPSLKSLQKGCEIEIINELPDNYLYIQCN